MQCRLPDRPRTRRPARPPAVLQTTTTDASDHNNTGPLGGPEARFKAVSHRTSALNCVHVSKTQTKTEDVRWTWNPIIAQDSFGVSWHCLLVKLRECWILLCYQAISLAQLNETVVRFALSTSAASAAFITVLNNASKDGRLRPQCVLHGCQLVPPLNVIIWVIMPHYVKTWHHPQNQKILHILAICEVFSGSVMWVFKNM